MSESEMVSQRPREQANELVNVESPLPVARPSRPAYHVAEPEHALASQARLLSVVEHLPGAEGQSGNGHPPGNVHRDLNQIIARAREDIRHLREELTRHEAQIATIVQRSEERRVG